MGHTTTPPAETPGAACTGPAPDPDTAPTTTPAEVPGAACTGPEADPCTVPAEAPAEPFQRPTQLPPFGAGARLVFNDEQRRRAQVIDAALVFLRPDTAVEPRVILHLAAYGPSRIVAIAKSLGIDRTTVFRRCRTISRGRYSCGRILPPRRPGLVTVDYDNRGLPGSTTTLRLTRAGADVAMALIGE